MEKLYIKCCTLFILRWKIERIFAEEYIQENLCVGFYITRDIDLHYIYKKKRKKQPLRKKGKTKIYKQIVNARIVCSVLLTFSWYFEMQSTHAHKFTNVFGKILLHTFRITYINIIPRNIKELKIHEPLNYREVARKWMKSMR